MEGKIEGIFKHSRWTTVLWALGIAFGAVLTLAFPFLMISGVETDMDTRFGFGMMFIIGLPYLVICNLCLFAQQKTRISVDGKGISALCGFARALDCSYSEVETVFCSFEQLTITLKNGKRYFLNHLEILFVIGALV